MSFEKFKELVGDLNDLHQAQSLAQWDMQTQMPEKGSGPRGKQLVTLGKMAHELLTSGQMREYMDSLRSPAGQQSLSEADRALIREMADKFDKATKLPTELVKRYDEAQARGFNIWIRARKANDFESFKGIMQELVDISRERAEALGYEKDPYDALMDGYEKGATVDQVDPLFDGLKDELITLVKAIKDSGRKPDEKLFKYTYPEEAQLAFSREILDAMGYDFSRGRLDKSAHPFTTELGGCMDVRITVRSQSNNPLECISTALHEGGHALYEQGISEEYLGTPLGSGTTLGIHESQSRLWENNVGRSLPFWQHFFPVMKRHFPDQLEEYDVESFYHVMNKVQPSLIRTEADEVTYNLHIMLRYEMEKDLINNRLQVADVPKVWNAKLQEYLGITPDSDANGCMQDVHWAEGYFGYFPTYALGNLYAAQFYRTAKTKIPNLEQKIAQGNLTDLHNWLRENIYKHGKTKTATQLAEEITGEPLNPQYFVDYLWEKYGDIYSIKR